MGHILLINPSEEMKQFGIEAADKIKAMFNISIPVSSVPTISVGAGIIEEGDAEVIFAPEPIATESLGIFFGSYERAKKKPVIITTVDNYNNLSTEIPDTNLIKNKEVFTKDYVFTVIRNLLTPENHKLDIRYIQSILNSVITVVKDNTQLELVANKISEQKAPEKPEDLIAIVGFHGDGFLGSLSFSTTKTLALTIASKMLFCEPSDVSDEMLLDVSGEIANQILGVVRTELSQFGYSLKNSFQGVVEGDQFTTSNASNGTYYLLPFTYDGVPFNVNLVYNTHKSSIAAIESLQSTNNLSTFDVRSLKAIEDSIQLIFKGNTGADINRVKIGKQDASERSLESFHVFHASGWKAEVSVGIEIPSQTFNYLAEKMIGLKPEDVENATVNDLVGELTNQIGGEFLKKLDKDLGFKLHRIYQGSYTQSEGINVLTKLPGYAVRLKYEIEGNPFIVILSLATTHSEEIFDAWKYIEKGESFQDSVKV